jgi:hypothetical protein
VSAGEAQLADVERLSEILSAKATPNDDSGVSHVYARSALPEPGGLELLLPVRCAHRPDQEPGGETTMTFDVDEGERTRVALAPRDHGPALVVRSGGGMAGQSFQPGGEDADRTPPECDVFLDDVTVSRRHAELQRAGRRSRSAISGA